ncbi:MAG TPA: GNAT family N-acetyltransferase [Clostridiaceae bacterium]
MIREINEADLVPCCKLLIDAYNCSPWDNHWDISTSLRYLKEYFEADRFVGFLAQDQTEVVAAIFAHEKTWWTKDELYIDELYVANKMQGKGFGGQLLEKVEVYSKDNNLGGITLLTDKCMPSAKFYHRKGFAKAKHVLFMYKTMKIK